MADIAEVLARPDVIKSVENLIVQAAVAAGVSQTHAERIALGMGARIEEGAPVPQLVAIGQAFRADADRAREILNAPPPREFDNAADELFWLSGVADALDEVVDQLDEAFSGLRDV